MGQAHKDSLTGRVLKAFSMFASVQVLSMLCSIVRNKLAAMWIGPLGVGVNSLYYATMDMLRVLFQFNLQQSAVQQISSDDRHTQAVACEATRRLSFWLGVITSVLAAALSPLLSRITFGTYAYTWGFLALSAMMFGFSISSGAGALMQGLGNLKGLAKSSVWAAVITLAASVPLLYFFRLRGIVPLLLVSVYALMTCQLIALRKGTPNVGLLHIVAAATFHSSEISASIKKMLTFGGYIALSFAATSVVDYALRVYIQRVSGSDAVGIFQAGYTIVNQFPAMIFAALCYEYYPRLTKTIHRTFVTRTVIAHEIAFVTAILLPLSLVFLVCERWVITFLYSQEFLQATAYMTWGIVGITMRGSSYCLAYAILAKGEGKTFVITETLGGVLYLGAAIPLYRWGGLAGLGIAYALQHFFSLLINGFVCYKRYGITFSRRLVAICILPPLIVTLAATISIVIL